MKLMEWVITGTKLGSIPLRLSLGATMPWLIAADTSATKLMVMSMLVLVLIIMSTLWCYAI